MSMDKTTNDPVELTKRLIGLSTARPHISPADIKRLERMVHDAGFIVDRVNDGGRCDSITGDHLLAQCGKGDVHLAFISHYDVVPAGEGWKTKPFTPTVIDDVLYGRGAADMKSGLAAQIIAGKELADLGMKVSLFIAGDEETYSDGMPALLARNNDKIHYAICGEPTSKSVAGDTIKVGRRGVVQGEIKVKGKQGHAAYVDPHDMLNVMRVVGGLLPALQSLPGDQGNADFPPSTCNVTYLSGGDGSYNVVPGSATLRFDARLCPETSAAQFETKLRMTLDEHVPSYELEITKSTPHFHTTDNVFRELVSRSIGKVTGIRPAYSCDGGTSDARFFAAAGIPVLEVGVPQGNMHGVDEFVRLVDIEKLREIYVAIGKNLLKK
mgnify:CR=1 FL=1